jgi:hypothetical protein
LGTLTPSKWTLDGTAYIACNCDYGCPCNFNALPSKGHCEGGWTWRVKSGAVDDVSLDGLCFSVFVKWPGAIHHGNGEGVILVDARASDAQRDAIAALVGGKCGGPWGVLAWTWPNVHGPRLVQYEIDGDGLHTKIRAGDSLELNYSPIKNPVSGVECHPAVVLPEGIIVKHADCGTSSVFTLKDAISLDHTGQYTAVGDFHYSWP